MSNRIRKVAVLGAGVMGSGIAAHLANAGVPVVLLDIVPPKAEPGEDTSSKAFRSKFAAGSIQLLKKAQSRSPLDQTLLWHEAGFFATLGDDASARRAYAEAIRLGPRSVVGYILAAKFELQAGRSLAAPEVRPRLVHPRGRSARVWRGHHHDQAG